LRLIILKYVDAIKIFENSRSFYNIPPEAKLIFVDKRIIELKKENEKYFELKDEVVWIGFFKMALGFYELACNFNGVIVRILKSR